MNKRIKEPKEGEKWQGKIIKAVIKLSNGWYVIKTENSKSPKDFKVKTIFSLKRDCPSICVNFIIAYLQIKSLSGCRYVANP